MQSQVFNLCSFEFAFGGFEAEAMVLHLPKNEVRSSGKLVECRGKDEDVVHVHNDEVLGDFVVEDFVHECLEGGRGVAESKKHDRRFEESIFGDERCFSTVGFFDANGIVSRSDVEFGEESGAFELV